jgi:hypothetical protein
MTGGNSLPDHWTCERLLVGMRSIGWDKFWGRDWFQHALCVIGISEFSLAVTRETIPKQDVSLSQTILLILRCAHIAVGIWSGYANCCKLGILGR